MLDSKDLKRAMTCDLLRLLAFAIEHDPAKDRLRATPPKHRDDMITQLYWLGVIQ